MKNHGLSISITQLGPGDLRNCVARADTTIARFCPGPRWHMKYFWRGPDRLFKKAWWLRYILVRRGDVWHSSFLSIQPLLFMFISFFPASAWFLSLFFFSYMDHAYIVWSKNLFWPRSSFWQWIFHRTWIWTLWGPFRPESFPCYLNFPANLSMGILLALIKLTTLQWLKTCCFATILSSSNLRPLMLTRFGTLCLPLLEIPSGIWYVLTAKRQLFHAFGKSAEK